MAKYSYPEDFEGTFWSVIDGDYYVSTFGNDISGDGSPLKPYLTVGKAFEFALDGEKVIVGPDEYVEQVPSSEVNTSQFGSEAPVKAVSDQHIDIATGGNIAIDGQSTVAGDRILLRAQINPAENGIYIVSNGAWSRAGDYSQASNIIKGKLIPVILGTKNGNSIFQNNTIPNITLGVTPLSFKKI
ncbi:hypothetical protein C9994_14850, partial [Marivirga lumbricoides]